MSETAYAKCACRACGKRLEFPVEAAGAAVPCPHCNQETLLSLPDGEPTSAGPVSPEAQPAGLSTSGALTVEEVLGAFQGSIPRTPVPFLYQIGLVIVAVTMIILPLIYLALIGAAGWAVYYWAAHFTFLLGGPGGARLQVVKFLAYATPLVIGGVVVLFMIKPLFARRPARAQPLALNRDAEPVLFAFIERICEIVGAPKPKRIDIDCNLNASAGFRRGLLSFLGNDLVLTIGLPLVAGMNMRQLAGVIAHEFGHFTQGFGMRLTYLIRTINAWFFRVACERDALDVSLDRVAEEGGDWRVIIIANLARLAVWASRLLLKALLFTGHLIGCFMLRQMEYDADSYEIKLAGSGAFESAFRRLHVLGEILGRAYKNMRTAWNLSHELPNNFPAHILRHDASFSDSERTKLEDTMGLEPTRWFDTHPSNGDRIRRARQAGEPGVFHLELPATMLFANFDVAARQVTMLHYQDDLGIPLEMVKLAPVDAAPRRPVPEAEPEPPAQPSDAALAKSPIRLRSRSLG